jgi:hypothetical protein
MRGGRDFGAVGFQGATMAQKKKSKVAAATTTTTKTRIDGAGDPPVMTRVSGWYSAGGGGRNGQMEAQAVTVGAAAGRGIAPAVCSLTLSRVTRSGRTEYCRMEFSTEDARRIGEQMVEAAAAAAAEGE